MITHLLNCQGTQFEDYITKKIYILANFSDHMSYTTPCKITTEPSLSHIFPLLMVGLCINLARLAYAVT